MVHEDGGDIIRRAVNRAVEAGIDFDVEHHTVWPVLFAGWRARGVCSGILTESWRK